MKEIVTNKYPFCLADRKKIRILKGGELDFDNMNKGYYDEIESKDETLRDLQRSLKETKSWTIKNSVYANKDVPKTWKTKLTYPTDVMKIISKDLNFFSYLTKSNHKEVDREKRNYSRNAYTPNINNEPNRSNHNSINNYSIKKDYNSSGNATSHKDSHFFSSNVPIEGSRPESSKVLKQTARRKTHANNVITYTEKEKREILDLYKEMFTARKPIIDNEMTKKETSANIITRDDFADNTLPNVIKPIPQQLSSDLKSQMFKSSIYSLLLPNKEFKGKMTEETHTNRSKSNAKKNKLVKSFGPFLNFDYEEFNKKIEIKNPDVKRVLEDINYYGPHFSHCPSCRNKNLEFYQLQEPHLCLNILNYLKKTRKKGKYTKNINTNDSVK